MSLFRDCFETFSRAGPRARAAVAQGRACPARRPRAPRTPWGAGGPLREPGRRYRTATGRPGAPGGGGSRGPCRDTRTNHSDTAYRDKSIYRVENCVPAEEEWAGLSARRHAHPPRPVRSPPVGGATEGA